MKKIHIIYNPNAGKSHRLEELVMALLRRDLQLSLFETSARGDAEKEAFARAEAQDVDALISYGGDGTLNEIVNGVMHSGKILPVALYSAGTVNDFANFLEIPKDAEAFAELVVRFERHTVDIGRINDRYFINVFSCGVASSVAHRTDRQLKSVFGSLAYYVEGLRELSTQGIGGRMIYIKSEEYLYNGEYFLFLVTNSSSTGGFSQMAPKASINDGKLNCLIIKKAPITEIIDILMKINEGKHIENDYVVYFETTKMYMETEDELDADGELFERSPVHIEVIPYRFQMIY